MHINSFVIPLEMTENNLQRSLRSILAVRPDDDLRDIDLTFLHMVSTRNAKHADVFLDLWRKRYDPPGRATQSAPDPTAHYYRAYALYLKSSSDQAKQYLEQTIQKDQSGIVEKLVKTFGTPY